MPSWKKPTLIPNTYGAYSTALVNLNHEKRLLFVHRGRHHADNKLWYQLYQNGKWMGDKELPQHYSSDGASLTMAYDSCFCFHRGREADDHVYSAQFVLDGEQWRPDTKLPDVRSARNPAAAEFTIDNTRWIVVVHRGGGEDNQLWWTKSDGHGWTDDAKLGNHTTSYDPVLVPYKNRLYCLHRGAVSDTQIYMTTFDGKSWSADEPLPDHHTGFVVPSIGGGLIGAAVYKDELHMVHKGHATDHSLWHAHYNGKTWSTDYDMSAVDAQFNGSGISLAAMDGVLYLCFLRGQDTAYFAKYD